jgi:hypothetical protein
MMQSVAAAVHPTEAENVLFAENSYAIRELARRAGIRRSTFEKWRIENDGDGYLSVYVNAGTNSHVRFPWISPDFLKKMRSSKCRTATATWMANAPGPRGGIGDFKIPFSGADLENVGPLFVPESNYSIRCTVDLLTSLLLVLSRFEETLDVPRDEHDRFSAFSSMAWRDSYLHRPIVDEWGLAFTEAVQFLLPGWQPERKEFSVKLGHDVDELGIPFRLQSAISHTVRRRAPRATLRDLASIFGRTETTYQLLLREVVGLAKARAIDSAVYWKFTHSGPHDTGYDPRDPAILVMLSNCRKAGVELGIHPSHQSYDSPAKFRREVSALKQLLEQNSLGGRQDFLRWRPETWFDWEEQGIAYDASVGFADHIGFRAGTCHPYRPWLVGRGREANLLEIPLIAMDSTLLGYMNLHEEAALEKVRDCIARCRAVGGVFSLVWHNTRIMNPRHRWLYTRILDSLQGSANYDWRSAYSEI